MDPKNFVMFLIIGFGLLFLLPSAQALEPGLSIIAHLLVVGYWGTLGCFFAVFVFNNLFSHFSFSHMVYNIWFFCSFICIAVGLLALIDDWPHKRGWAVWVIIYGGIVCYCKREEF